MTARVLLRGAAIAIALAGVIDPTLTRKQPVHESIVVVALGGDAVAPALQLQRRLRGDYESALRIHEEPSRAAACPSQGGCIIVSTGAAPARLTAGATVIGAIETSAEARRGIAAVSVPPQVVLSDSSTLHVTLRGGGRVEILDGAVPVGSAESKDGGELDVPWVPIDEGARALRVKADADVVDVAVVVDGTPAPIGFFEPEATWFGTFVRRALEDDPRFSVGGRTELAPPVAVTRGAVPQLTRAMLAEVRAVVVTAPDRLTAAQVDLLERFVARRGGSLVVILDRRPAGPLLRLLPGLGEERHEPQPRSIGALRAVDLLSFEAGPGVTTVDADDRRPIVVSQALGRGRVVVSGAMDAWRHRDDSGAFDDYWTALVWEAAAAAGDPLRVAPRTSLARPGEEVPVEVEVQTLEEVPADLVAQGRYECTNERGMLRLWPQARPGTFAGVFTPNVEGECRLEIAAAGRAATAPVLVKADVRRREADGRLKAAVIAHGGVVVTPGHEDELLSHVRQRLPRRHEPATLHPMHSPLWIVPFVACLGGDWFLRRRNGLR